ncbi:hypothetical protein BCF46_0512 [Litoreibacter meonggei]|uniref:Uncharacterized protein n=1 Tax=Litoreibacter meonggei TaxID=1049199 RepID=A0A497X5B1_9RHOB|nr:hypothetical protein BCF46_0512 [Litoreibacter meonggei]
MRWKLTAAVSHALVWCLIVAVYWTDWDNGNFLACAHLWLLFPPFMAFFILYRIAIIGLAIATVISALFFRDKLQEFAWPFVHTIILTAGLSAARMIDAAGAGSCL